MAPRAGLEPATYWLHLTRITARVGLYLYHILSDLGSECLVSAPFRLRRTWLRIAPDLGVSLNLLAFRLQFPVEAANIQQPAATTIELPGNVIFIKEQLLAE